MPITRPKKSPENSPAFSLINTVWWAGTIGLLVFAGLCGVILYTMRITAPPSSSPERAQEQSAVTPSASPSAKPADIPSYELWVLNGSGISGDAAKAQTLLEANQIPVFSVGNADSPSYADTVIQAPNNVSKPYLEKLKQTLENAYIVSPDIQPGDSDVKITVIIGKARK